MADIMPVMKLGKLAPKHDMRIPMLAKYTANLPAPPASCNWGEHGPADWGAMLNTTLGDCTCAGVGHAIQAWTLQSTGKMLTLPDSTIIGLYEKFGYVPGDASTDNGAVETDVLKYWLKNPVDGHSLDGFVALQPHDIKDIKDAIWLFGGAYIGVALPISAQGQSIWLVPPEGLTGNGAPGSWGGHCVYVVGYDHGSVYFISWGKLMRMSWNFWWAYTDESYGLLSPDWIEVTGMAPSDFDRAALVADMAALRQAA
ncbi:hypothetical protein [Methylovirgula sp. HY1]|uniref:hypothetical protein n=1 Tax=Methylovirgula sp. HY1 TaxID=2822761 RepID=UPI001C5BDCE0|nr:hypothetical protein [Methylovirgula sp. HY1]QXX74213.1 hypothetical protein MHY1_01023 [Methylovirgula sp. HY1]